MATSSLSMHLLRITSVVLDEHLVEAEVKQVIRDSCRTLDVLLDQLPRWLLEKLVNLLKSLVLGLRHEQNLVEPAKHSDTAVETERQTGLGHGILHASEVVGDDEGREEEPASGGGHSVGTKVRGVNLGRNDPGKSSVRTEEKLIEDKASQVNAKLRGKGVELVADTDEDQTDEEAWQHGNSPEATSTSLHEEDRRDGTDKERSTSNQRHVSGIVGVESNLVHEYRHVVHDRVNSGELSQEDHHVSIDDSTTSTRLGEEVHPGEPVGTASGDLGLFLLGADFHDEELFACFWSIGTSDALPYLESFQCMALVHQVSWRLGHEEDTDTHDGTEDERAAKDVTPATLDSNEHGSNGIAEHFSESNHELVE